MLFHTLKTITINQFGLLTNYPEDIARIRIRLPKKVINYYINRLRKDYNKMLTKEKTEGKPDIELENRYSVANIEIRINLFVILYDVLRNHWITPAPPDILNLYKKYFKKDFELEDLMVIVQRIDALKKRLAKMLESMKQEAKTTKDFNSFIIDVESILEKRIGDEKLYKLPYYLEQVDYIIENKKKQSKPTGHGRDK